MDLKVKDNGKDEIAVMDGEKEVRGWSYADEHERRRANCFHGFGDKLSPSILSCETGSIVRS